MEISFPAMKGHMGQRDYYVAMMKLVHVSRLFEFKDWSELPPELRAQRVLQSKRIPEITQYILDNEDGYIFSALTASYDCEPDFVPSGGDGFLGILTMPFEAKLIINDGQHRRAAIERAIKENPALEEETISVVLFPFEDLDRMQQMFSDLNRTVRKTSKSLDILYNHRDDLSQLTLAVISKNKVFNDLVDKDRVSLPQRSPKLFTLGSLYDSNKALLGNVTEDDFDEKFSLAVDFWDAIADNIPEWRLAAEKDLKPYALRQEYIHSHAVVLWGLGAMGRTLIMEHPNGWKSEMTRLRDINWKRTNKEWQSIAMSGDNVINRRQSRMDTGSFIKLKMGLPLTPSEERSLKGATDISSLTDALRELVK